MVLICAFASVFPIFPVYRPCSCLLPKTTGPEAKALGAGFALSPIDPVDFVETCAKLCCKSEAAQSFDCYPVGSLDFNFLVEIKGVSTKPPKVKHFAGGSTATKKTGDSTSTPPVALIQVWNLWAGWSGMAEALPPPCPPPPPPVALFKFGICGLAGRAWHSQPGGSLSTVFELDLCFVHGVL